MLLWATKAQFSTGPNWASLSFFFLFVYFCLTAAPFGDHPEGFYYEKGRTPQPQRITFASCRLYAATPEDHVYSLLFQVIAPSCNPPRGARCLFCRVKPLVAGADVCYVFAALNAACIRKDGREQLVTAEVCL